jgi:hypothetical protein
MAVTQDAHTSHPVRSEPLTNGKPLVRGPRTGGEWGIGIALIIFGSVGWLAGARYTLIGWVTGINMFLAWIGLPLVVPVPVGWWILLMLPLGVVYSRVEMQVWTAHRRHGQALALFVTGWLLIVFTDVVTTYLGVRSPAPDAWPITQTVADSALLSIMWAAILTFVSDWLIIGGAKFLRR